MYTVFILFTVSNYPDVSMAYFKKNRMTMFYFWTYLLIGIFLLSNLLLAQIFINYKSLIDGRLKKYELEVDQYFHDMFDAITGNDKIKEAIAAKEEKEKSDCSSAENDETTADPALKLKEFITTEEMIKVMGGKDVVDHDKRLTDMIW